MTQSLPRTGVAPMLADLPMSGFRVTGMADAVADDDAATKGQLSSVAPPVGSVLDFAGSIAPTGWLLCYGQAISRTTYSALFAVIGTAFGTGDGTTTFNVPDARGRVSAGKDNMGGTAANRLTNAASGIVGTTLGAAGGSQTHTLTAAQMPTHTHGAGNLAALSAGAHTHGVPLGTGTVNDANFIGSTSVNTAKTVTTTSAGAHTHNIAGTTSSAGSGDAHPNVQPTLILTKIIRY